VHARNDCRPISTSDLKSDVTIVFLDHDFLEDEKISAIRIHLRHIGLLIICMGFQDLLAENGFWGGKIGEGVVRY